VCTRENNNYYKIIKGEPQQKSNLSEEAVDHGLPIYGISPRKLSYRSLV
jgi:hypothetical protein